MKIERDKVDVSYTKRNENGERESGCVMHKKKCEKREGEREREMSDTQKEIKMEKGRVDI